MTVHYRSCTLCEATCGVAIETDGDRVVSVRGDDADPFSRGYICPKAAALADLHHDPDRLRRPLIRDGASWREAGWDEALDLVAAKFNQIIQESGPNAIAGLSSARAVNEDSYYMQRLFREVLGNNNIDHCARV